MRGKNGGRKHDWGAWSSEVEAAVQGCEREKGRKKEEKKNASFY